MNAKRTQTRPRRGYTLLELAVSVMVLMTAMIVSVRVLGWVGNERRASDRRQWALQTASNVLERVSREPFERVTPETVKSIAAATAAERALPDPAWEVAVDVVKGEATPSKRVTLGLRWKERSGELGAPVRLTSWVFRTGAAK